MADFIHVTMYTDDDVELTVLYPVHCIEILLYLRLVCGFFVHIMMCTN
jgi:hypothetical protein